MQSKKMIKRQNRISKNYGTITKISNIYIKKTQEEEKEKGTEEIFKVMTKIFIKLKINTKPQIQEAYRILSRINIQRSTPRHVILRDGVVQPGKQKNISLKKSGGKKGQ